MAAPTLPVLLYDGTCGLCQRVVLFLLRHDRRQRLHFAPLQSIPGQKFLRARGLPATDFDSLVYVSNWNDPASPHLLRTDGALAALHQLGPPWSELTVLRHLPRFIRDGAYRLISRTRFALFGTYRPQPLPNPAWAARFLAR